LLRFSRLRTKPRGGEGMDDDVKKFLISLAQLLKWIEQAKTSNVYVQVERDSETVSEVVSISDHCVKG
jgi:hypothetical protein